jgi:hypothetical protein
MAGKKFTTDLLVHKNFKTFLLYAKGNKRIKAAKMFIYNFCKSLGQPVNKQLTAV